MICLHAYTYVTMQVIGIYIVIHKYKFIMVVKDKQKLEKTLCVGHISGIH